MKVFNSINEITYNDWLEYETMATVECNISNKRRMSVVAAIFALFGSAAIAGAVILGGGAAIGLAILAGCSILTSGLSLFAGFGAADDETQPKPTKEDYAQAERNFKELKKSHQWKKYDKLMREYWFSQKYRDDRDAYLAEKQNKVAPVERTSVGTTKNKKTSADETEFDYLDSSNATV